MRVHGNAQRDRVTRATNPPRAQREALPRAVAITQTFALLTALAARSLPVAFTIPTPAALVFLLGAALVEELVFRKLLARYPLVQIAAFAAVAAFAYGTGVAALPFLLVVGVLATALARAFSWKTSFAYRALALLAIPFAAQQPTQAFSLLLLFGALAAPLFERASLDHAIRTLSLHQFNARRALLHGAGLFLALLLLLVAEQFVLRALGAFDANVVADFIRTQPTSLLAFAVLAAQLGEELAFRGFLQKKIGVVLASALFAGLHYGFGSVAELAAAFTAAMLFGYYVRKHDDVFPAIVAHALYNGLSVLLVVTGAAG